MNTHTLTRWAVVLGGLLVASAGCEEKPAPPAPPATASAPATAPAKADEGLTRLFNGKDLTGWKVLDDGYFDSAGAVYARDGALYLGMGQAMTGVRWAGKAPTGEFEIKLEAMRVEGEDFFCGLNFPVEKGQATLIMGGWGGQVVGISNVDGLSADENETTRIIEFEKGRWYRIHVLVTDKHVDVWLDDEKIIELETDGRKFDVWPQQEDACPLGITTWYTTGALRNITLRQLET